MSLSGSEKIAIARAFIQQAPAGQINELGFLRSAVRELNQLRKVSSLVRAMAFLRAA
jgi:hypothetical protein